MTRMHARSVEAGLNSQQGKSGAPNDRSSTRAAMQHHEIAAGWQGRGTGLFQSPSKNEGSFAGRCFPESRVAAENELIEIAGQDLCSGLKQQVTGTVAGTRAVISTNSLAAPALFTETPAPVDHGGEATDDRAVRRTVSGACYLGVMTICDMPPGTNSVLLPLPLFIRRPCAPLPGSVVVSIEPVWPAMNACPLGVITDRPVIATGEPRSATGVAADKNGPAPRAQAWAYDPTGKAMAITAGGIRTMRVLGAKALIVSLSFPQVQHGSPDDGRQVFSGRRVRRRSRRVTG
jgi:hypothetical protein